MKKHVHFIGIAGQAMASIAKMFLKMGWKVTGSDQEAVYPPATTYLQENKIDFFRGYSEKNIKGKPDLVVVGRSALLVNKENPELVHARKLGCQILSYPEVLRDFLVKENSIVVVGTYGKTTCTALIAWILEEAGFNPSFMIGGVPLNFSDGVRHTSSSYSVVEGDETPAMFETDLPKFMFYKPRFVLLTAAKWDHPEVFKNEKAYLEAFKKFVRLIPENGFLVACRDGENVKEVAKEAKCKVIWYPPENKDKETLSLKTSLLGKHNWQNILGCVALSLELGVKPNVIKRAVGTFKGIRGRLEFLGQFGGVIFFGDFAQHPTKVKETLSALRTKFPKERIFCVFDPHARILQQRESLAWFKGCFDQASEVLVTKATFLKEIGKEKWVKGPEIVKAIGQTQGNVFYEPVEEKVVDYLTGQAKSGDIIIFMSSGGTRTPQIMGELMVIARLGKTRVRLYEPLSRWTTFKIGGPADLFYEAKSIEEIVEAVGLCQDLKIPYFILGGGSNVLVSDKGIQGMVIKINPPVGGEKLKIKNEKVLTQAGVSLSLLVEETAKNGLSGLEFCAGIPGTVGGAVVGNAGAWQKSFGEKVLQVKVLASDGQIKWVKHDDCQFAYRESRFKESQEVVLEVELDLAKGEKERIQKEIEENLKKRKNQPKESSAGSVFINPKPLSAGALIEKCGLKGKRQGQAQISPQHGNFIVNLGGASCQDVLQLIMLAKRAVKEKFGLILEEEIKLVGRQIKDE